MNGGAGGTGGSEGGAGPTDACAPAVTRGGDYFDFPERLNRYSTDCAWQASSTVYVSPDGNGDGSSPASPADVSSALLGAVPGRMIRFSSGTYDGCFELDSDHSGTYDEPITSSSTTFSSPVSTTGKPSSSSTARPTTVSRTTSSSP